MKIQYELKTILAALDYWDIKGLIKLINPRYFAAGEPSLTEMEEYLEETFPTLDLETKKEIERLMLSCARVNSIGY